MWYAHASRAANQAPSYAMVQPEQVDAIVKEGRRDHESMRGCIFLLPGRRQGGVYRGGGDFQMPGKDVGLVIQQLAGGPLECW